MKIELDDKIWSSLEGGYRTSYDASLPLKRLEAASSSAQMQPVFKELWEELHHHGDVGIAYLAVPQLARIAKEKDVFDSNILGLCAVIEQQRHLGANPQLPIGFSEYYENGLNELKSLILSKIGTPLDSETFRIACSTLATVSDEIKVGKAILELDGATMDEFLEQF